jgi:hypothetical protein
MPHRPAKVTQSDIARARAAKEASSFDCWSRAPGGDAVSTSENLPAISRRPCRSALVRIRIKLIQANVVSFASPGLADEIWRKLLKAALGTASDAFVDMALHHLQRAARMPGEGPSNDATNGALAIIEAFAPRNEAEAALALQAACTHKVAMVMMARIGGGHGTDPRLPALASVTAKLVRAYCSTLETHRRLRDGGDQNIRVEHVHVHEGGQAIVGAVNSRAHGVKG